MNILDKVKTVLNMPDVKLGFMPDSPDAVIILFEYQPPPPEHHFGGTDFIQNVQARIRDTTAAEAYAKAKTVAEKLNRYSDAEISVLQSTPILDIGRDEKLRQEYTVNFEIRRY